MRRAVPLALAAGGAAALLTFPLWSPERFWVSVVIDVLISGLLAMSLDLLVGYGGMPSLGHAAFFGTGAYAFALVAKRATASVLVALPAAALAAAVAAVVIGALSVRASGIFFLMLTLAFAQMLYALAFGWIPVTGGSDGLAGVPRPDLGIAGVNLFLTSNFYLYVATVFLLCAIALVAITRSSFGLSLAGVRENERRMRALGYDTTRIRLVAFVVAGAFAGIAGALRAAFDQFAAPQDVFVTTSVTALVMVLVGGAGTLAGPVLGAAIVVLLRTYLSSAPLVGERWETLLGLLFISTVLFFPRGLVGVVGALRVWPRSS
jgi:branched-chain amino acid transport system permease protein